MRLLLLVDLGSLGDKILCILFVEEVRKEFLVGDRIKQKLLNIFKSEADFPAVILLALESEQTLT